MKTSHRCMFIPLDSTGHVNACIGIAEQLVAQGQQVTFVLETAWNGRLESNGFNVEYYTDPTRPPNLGPNEHWMRSMNLIKDTLHCDALYKAGHQELKEFVEFLNNELPSDDQIATIIEKIDPDIIIVDNYVTVPAVYKSGRKWIMMTSANPLIVISHEDTPPGASGYAINSDRKQWRLFEETFWNHYGPVIVEFQSKVLALGGIEKFPEGSTFHPSPYLNIYAYPEELDYLDVRPLPPTWKRFDHFIRNSTTEHVSCFEVPEKLRNQPGRLIYVSMGSMGCVDRRLMERLVKIFSGLQHRFMIVMGPNHGTIDLPSNIYGDRSLPQIDLLPMVDLFITHGGNNSILEAILFGRPVIVCPLFGDQYDNATRVEEKGFGRQINAYTCNDDEIRSMIDEMLNDHQMYERLERASNRMRSSNSTTKAAETIVKLCDT